MLHALQRHIASVPGGAMSMVIGLYGQAIRLYRQGVYCIRYGKVARSYVMCVVQLRMAGAMV